MSVGAVNKQTGDRIPTAGMPAIDDALDLTSVNPVQNAIITAALANKQDKTDNSLQTTDKTVVGAINEHEGDIDSLRSGLINLDNEVNGDATTYPYADVITIEDAVPANLADCSVKIEPVQDLHGYDKPWVGGAGKNKLDITLAEIKTLNTDGTWSGDDYTINGVTYKFTANQAGNITRIKANGTASGGSASIDIKTNFAITPFVGNIYTCLTSQGGVGIFRSSIQQGGEPFEEFARDTGSGGVVSAPSSGTSMARIWIAVANGQTVSNLEFLPMIRLATETDATFAPYTNICPISGHTDASVQRDGKNWFDYTKATANNRVNIDTGNLEVQNGFYASDYIEVFAQQIFTLNYVYSSLAQYGMAFYDANKTFVSGRKQKQAEGDTTFTYTVPNGCKYVRFTVPTDITVSSVQMELGQSATDYEPFKGKTYTIALGDTIYGGTVDFDSGVMTVTHAVVDMSSLSWTERSSTTNKKLYSTTISDRKYGQTISILCENYNYGGWVGSMPDVDEYDLGVYAYYLSGQTNNTVYCITTDTDVIDGNMVYELTTPTTIQLTPQQIQLLKGTNTLTASTGQISVTANGVSGSIGAVQEQVNGLESGLTNVGANVVHLTEITTDTAGRAILTNTYDKLYKVIVNYTGSSVFTITRPTFNGKTMVMCLTDSMQPLSETEVTIDLYYLV